MSYRENIQTHLDRIDELREQQDTIGARMEESMDEEKVYEMDLVLQKLQSRVDEFERKIQIDLDLESLTALYPYKQVDVSQPEWMTEKHTMKELLDEQERICRNRPSTFVRPVHVSCRCKTCNKIKATMIGF